jgi:predicted nucleic acid-binding protein
MQKNILIDLNVILDVLLERTGFNSAQRVIELSENNGYRLYISAHMVTTFAYLLENAKVPNHQIKHQLSWLLETFVVIPLDGNILKDALKSHIEDYEDAVVEQAAITCKATVIVTRNIKDFKESRVQALTPEAYLQI